MAPNSFLVERSIVTSASADAVYALVDDLRNWQQWSPWEDLDPELTRDYSGPESGVGASYAWRGNRKAGIGSMAVTESVPAEKVVIDLTFVKPFKAQSVVAFFIEPTDDATEVTWRMTGRETLFFRLFGFVVSMDKLVGKDFEKGLAKLKAVAETADRD